MSSNPLFATLRRFIHPFPALEIAPGTVRSDLDGVAQRIGQTEVEEYFVDNASAQVMTRACIRYFDDDDAKFILRKSYHLALEGRMRILALRADPPDTYGVSGVVVSDKNHPLDRVAQRLLSKQDNRAAALSINPTLLDRFRQIFAAANMGAAFLSRVVFLLLRYGRRYIEPKTYRVAASGWGSHSYWKIVQSVASDVGVWDEHSLFFVMEHEVVASTLLEGEFPYVRIGELPVQRDDWVRKILMPAMRLFCTAIFELLRGGNDPRLVQIVQDCFFTARHSLNYWRITQNFHFRYYLDIDEYTATHIAKAIILRKAATKLVRWPHSHIDSPGATLSYLVYDFFLASGPYMARCYGDSWYSNCTSEAVGFLPLDQRFASTERVQTEYKNVISDRLSAGDSIIVLFTPSADSGLKKIFQAILRSVIRQLETRKNWFLVIKPKGLHAQQFYASALFDDPVVSAQEHEGRILIPRYTALWEEVCPAGWLIKHMDLGIGLGSVQIESLTQEKLTLWHSPTFQKTPLNEILVRHGLLYKNCDSFEAGLGRRMDDPTGTDIPYDWIRENFDPFGDDQAFSRIAHLLWGGGLESPDRETARSPIRKTA